MKKQEEAIRKRRDKKQKGRLAKASMPQVTRSSSSKTPRFAFDLRKRSREVVKDSSKVLENPKTRKIPCNHSDSHGYKESSRHQAI